MIDKSKLLEAIRLYLDRSSLGETTAQTELSIGEICSIINDQPEIKTCPRCGTKLIKKESNMKPRNNKPESTKLSKQQFYDYIVDNFIVHSEALRLISNILDFVQQNYEDKESAQVALIDLLDGTIGLTSEEINAVEL